MLVGPNAVSILGTSFRFTVSADKRKRLKAIWTRMNSDEHGLKNYNLVRLGRVERRKAIGKRIKRVD
jgi:hypothetical protein